jgi:hypothetical protein
MATTVHTAALVSQFVCLGERCEDTCCKGWGMQVDAATVAKYAAEAPELLDAVASEDNSTIMRRDAQTDYCVKFDDGLCGIHKARGAAFLGDACYFYPRVTRALGAATMMTAAPSCPEIARLALLGADDPFALTPVVAERLPQTLKDYLPDGLDADAAVAIHRHFIAAAGDAAATPELVLSRLCSVARSLDALEAKDWAAAVPFYLRSADGRLAAPEVEDADPFNVLHALCGLAVATRKAPPARLVDVIAPMERALRVSLDWHGAAILTHDDSLAAYQALAVRWGKAHDALAPVLRRWIQLQLSLAMFPFAGFGDTLTARITVITVRFATLRLALMCAMDENDMVSEEKIIAIAQPLARLLDHLANPAYSLSIYESAGWMRESRLRGLLMAPSSFFGRN